MNFSNRNCLYHKPLSPKRHPTLFKPKKIVNDGIIILIKQQRGQLSGWLLFQWYI